MASFEAKVVMVRKTVIDYLLGFTTTDQPNLLYLQRLLLLEKYSLICFSDGHLKPGALEAWGQPDKIL